MSLGLFKKRWKQLHFSHWMTKGTGYMSEKNAERKTRFLVEKICSDEKKFNCDSFDCYLFYWDDLSNYPRLFSRLQDIGPSLMLWGAIFNNGTVSLVTFEGGKKASHTSGWWRKTFSSFLIKRWSKRGFINTTMHIYISLPLVVSIRTAIIFPFLIGTPRSFPLSKYHWEPFESHTEKTLCQWSKVLSLSKSSFQDMDCVAVNLTHVRRYAYMTSFLRDLWNSLRYGIQPYSFTKWIFSGFFELLQ